MRALSLVAAGLVVVAGCGMASAAQLYEGFLGVDQRELHRSGQRLSKFFKNVLDSHAFHYLRGLYARPYKASERVPDVHLSLSVGSDNLQWYPEPGDRIIDSYIVRDVFGLPENA